MNLQITGKCNYNCKHCFNAKDNAPLQTELTLEETEANDSQGYSTQAFYINT